MVGETAQHAGHADIVKELIVAGGAGAAGRTGERLARVQAAAEIDDAVAEHSRPMPTR